MHYKAGLITAKGLYFVATLAGGAGHWSVSNHAAGTGQGTADHEVNGGKANHEASGCGAANRDTSRQAVGV